MDVAMNDQGARIERAYGRPVMSSLPRDRIPFPIIISTASRSPGVDPGRAIAAMATVANTGSLLDSLIIGSVAAVLTLRGALGLLALAGVIMPVIGGVVQPTASVDWVT
jgi:hypothetical protein